MRAYYNNAGDIVCLYKTEHKAFKQYTFIEITDAQHKLFIEHQQNYKIIDGKFTFVETPAPTLEQIQKELTAAVQAWADNKVQERNYDNVDSLAKYSASKNPKYKAEFEAVSAWIGDVWDKCYAILDEVMAGKRDIPTLDELIAELPPLIWPDEVSESGEA